MRVWTRTVHDIDGNLIEGEWYEYEGPVAEAKTGGSPSGAQNVTQTTKAEPWSAQIPYLKFGFQQAKDEYQSARPEFYPGPLTVPFAPETEAALAAQTERATAGSPLNASAQGLLFDTVGGNYLDAGNPYLQGAFDRAANPVIRSFKEEILPGIDSGFAKAGRYGSGLHKTQRDSAYDRLAENLTEKAGELSYRNYQDERENMLRSALFAPSLAATDYEDISKLAQVGMAKEAKDLEGVDEAVARHNFEQTSPAAKIAQYMGLIQGNYGGTQDTTTSSPIYSNSLAQWLGAGAAGLGAIGSLGGLGGAAGLSNPYTAPLALAGLLF